MNTLLRQTIISPTTDLGGLEAGWIYDCVVPWCEGHERGEAHIWDALLHRSKPVPVPFRDSAEAADVSWTLSAREGLLVYVAIDGVFELPAREADEIASFFDRLAAQVRSTTRRAQTTVAGAL